MNGSRQSHGRLRALLLATLAGACALLGGAGTARPDTHALAIDPAPTIAFVQETRTSTSVDAEIFLLDRHEVLTQLTDYPGFSLSPAWSPDGAKLAFSRQASDPAHSGIYVVGADGSGLTRLTDGFAGDDQPAWSPDGTQIAFASNRDGDYDIFVMNADGSGVRPLTANAVDDGHPSWSPDGTRIAFEGFRPGVDGNDEIWTVGIDGGGLTNVTEDDDCNDAQPDWNPVYSTIAYVGCGAVRTIDADGGPADIRRVGAREPDWDPGGLEFAYTDGTVFPLRVCRPGSGCPVEGYQPDIRPKSTTPVATSGRIAFTSDRDGNSELYAVAPDGSAASRLTSSPVEDVNASWSADGRQIAWSSGGDIVRMPAGGGAVTPVTSGPEFDLQPTWSPDGSRIAFVSDRAGALQIWVVATNGSGLVQLTTGGGFNVDPVWSRDGTSIVFTSNRDGNEEIYVMGRDGSNQRRLTDDPGRDYGPYLSPTGSAIVFGSERDGNPELYVMGPSGLGQTRLTFDPSTDTGPAWSPDGAAIAFASNRDGDFEIFTIPAAGGTATQLTFNTSSDRLPDWQPVVAAGADTDPPALTLPGSVTIEATSPAGAVVTFSVTATDGVDPSPTVACSPASGSTFAVGTTVVSCTAADASGNSASGSFSVTVLGARAQLLDLAARVAAGAPPRAGAALVRVAARFDPNDPVDRRAACSSLNAFVVLMRATSGRTVPAATAAEWIADALRIRTVLGC